MAGAAPDRCGRSCRMTVLGRSCWMGAGASCMLLRCPAGVVRNLGSRDGWAKQWTAFMEQPLLPAPTLLKFAGGLDAGRLMSAEELGVAGDPKPEAMTGAAGSWAGRAGRQLNTDEATSSAQPAYPCSAVLCCSCAAGGESRARELLDSFLGGCAAGCERDGPAGAGWRCMLVGNGAAVCSPAQPCKHNTDH